LTTALSPATGLAWVDDYVDNAVYTGPSSYDNQRRGFYTAGTVSTRLDLSVDNPIQVSLPKISAGCGGIDAFLGGITFLDTDYLVDKFQGIVQAAPALAFSIALKTMSKELDETMTKLEAATNWLNNIQMDECAMANRFVTEVSSDDPKVMSGLWNEMTGDVSLREAVNRSWDDTQNDIDANDGQPTLDLKDEIRDCPAQFRRLVQPGSFVENVVAEYGLVGQADIIRGYVGDVFIQAGPADNVPLSQRVIGCPENDESAIEDMIYGYAREKTVANVCRVNGAPLRTRVANDMTAILNNTIAGVPLTVAQQNLIGSSPIPFLPIMVKAYSNNTAAFEIEHNAEIVAGSLAYQAVSDMYRNVTYALEQVNAASKPLGVDPAAGGIDTRCNTALYEPVFANFAEMRDRLKIVKEGVFATYNKRLQEHLTMLEYTKIKEEEGRKVTSEQSRELLRKGE